MMRTRYEPHQVAPGSWGLLDWHAMELCSLPDDKGRSKLLTWSNRHAADAWLQRCYLLWAKWERDGGGEAPANWRPRRELSPYSNGLPFPRRD